MLRSALGPPLAFPKIENSKLEALESCKFDSNPRPIRLFRFGIALHDLVDKLILDEQRIRAFATRLRTPARLGSRPAPTARRPDGAATSGVTGQAVNVYVARGA